MLVNYNKKSTKQIIDEKKYRLQSKLTIYQKKIIISLTSYSKRILTVEPCIDSIINQSYQNFVIILWMAEKDYNEKFDIVENLKNKYEINKFQVRITKDIGSYKKLIPALIEFPKHIIVTADDDVIYPDNWLQNLVDGYKKQPDCIIACRCHRIKLDSRNNILPYKEWNRNYKYSSASYRNFATGVGGILYPPNSLSKIVFKEKLFSTLCPNADDVWFWAMAILNNRKVFLIDDPLLEINYIEGTQEDQDCKPLWYENYRNGKNDIYLNNVISSIFGLKNKLKEKLRRKTIKVSVVVPIYKTKPEYLEKCLNSIIKQDFDDIEIICVDDGSKKRDTKEILKKIENLDKRIKLLHQKNKGPGSARNRGIRLSKGKYLSFIDSDDWVSENFIGELYKTAEENGAWIAATNSVYNVFEDGRKVRKDCGLREGDVDKKQMCANAIVKTGVSWNKLYLRNFLIKNNIYYLENNTCVAEDNYFTDLCLINVSGQISVNSSPKYYYKQTETSITNIKQNILLKKIREVYVKIFCKIRTNTKNDNKFWNKIIYRRFVKDIELNKKKLNLVE